MIKLYRHALSGHSHRAQLFLSLLGLEYEMVDIDLAAGEHKQPAFLAKNSFGKVPVLDDDGRIINDSNGILVYLAKKYDPQASWYPDEPEKAADVQRWLSVAAGEIASGPASARLVNVFGAQLDKDALVEKSHALLGVLEAELGSREFLVGNSPTIADVAGYAYIAHAPEGDVSLASYPNVREWLTRIQALPGFVGMQETAVGLAA